jgi:hypothetical protein
MALIDDTIIAVPISHQNAMHADSSPHWKTVVLFALKKKQQ